MQGAHEDPVNLRGIPAIWNNGKGLTNPGQSREWGIMLDWFKTTFLGALGPALAFFSGVFNPLIALVLGAWAFVQIVYSLIGKGWEAVTVAKLKYTEMMAYVGQSVFGQLPTQLSQAVGYFNSFLPLTEGLILVTLVTVFYTLCVVLRVLKSWIPTIG